MMPNPEGPPQPGQQPPTPEQGAEVPGSQAEQVSTPEEAEPSQSASVASDVEQAATAQEIDNEEVVGWMVEAGIDNIDADTFHLFQKALTEKYADKAKNPDAWAQAVKYIKELPKILAGFDQQIKELAGKEGFKDIESKRDKIVQALTVPLLNGHLEADDLSAMVSGMKIISDEEAEGATEVVEGVCFFDHDSCKIKISVGFLRDRPKDKPLDIKHLMSHEVSHAVVRFSGMKTPEERAQITNYIREGTEPQSEKFKFIFDIINKAEETKNYQPQHIRNVLSSMANIDSDFAHLDQEEKEKYSNDPEVYRRSREAIAAEEIMADYTAFFLESGGSRKDFYMKYLNNVGNGEGLKVYLAQNKITENQQAWVANINNKIENGDDKEAILAENPALKKMLDSCDFFYDLVSSSKDGFKGKLAECIKMAREDQGDEEEIDIESILGVGGYMPDQPSGFTKPDAKSQGKDKGLKNEIAGFFAAFADEIDITKGAIK